MGLFSSSSRTTQTQQTNNESTQISVGDVNGQYISGWGNTLMVLEPEAVKDSLDANKFVTELAFKNADNAMEFAAGAFSKGIDSVLISQDNAYQFSAGMVQTAIGAVVQSVDGQRQTVDRTLEYGAGVTKLAFESADTARENSLQFAAGALKEATSIQNKTLELNAKFATETFNQIRESNLNARADVNSATNNAFSFSSGAFTKALDSTTNQAKSYAVALTDFADKTIATAVQSTKSEAAQATDKIIDLTQNTTKYVLMAVGGIAAVFLLFRSK